MACSWTERWIGGEGSLIQCAGWEPARHLPAVSIMQVLFGKEEIFTQANGPQLLQLGHPDGPVKRVWKLPSALLD